MYCWGNSENGELGLGGIEEEKVFVPRPLSIPTSHHEYVVQSISCGLNHTLFLVDGQIYSCGSNDFGQLGHSKLGTKKPELIDQLDSRRCVQLSCGIKHSLAVSEWGDVYSWGSNNCGQLGDPSSVGESSPIPRLVKGIATKKVVQISCGSEHCFVLTDYGSVYCWGNNSHGQLGLGYKSDMEPEPKHMKSLDGVPIAQLACGGWHSFIVTQLGAVYGWGRNDFGQLGLNDEVTRCNPTQLKALRSQRVRYVSCGENHTAILTEDGGVFTFGSASYGQLGHGGISNEILPKKVLELMGSCIIQVTCGRFHTLVYEANKGRIFGFGLGRSGQLGNCLKFNTNSPVQVAGPWDNDEQNNIIVQKLFAGGNQSFAIISKKTLRNQPDDLRKFPTTGTIQKMLVSYADECAKIEDLEITPQEIISYLETVFGSATCINASFILTGSERVPCSLLNPCVNIIEAKMFFDKISRLKKQSLNELILNTLSSDLLPNLPTSPPDIEGLRVFIILPYCHLLEEPFNCHTVIKPFGSALLNVSRETNKVITKWWSTLDKGTFLRHVLIFKGALVFAMENDNYNFETFRCFHVLIRVLAKLNQLNMENKLTIPYESFYVPELTEKLDIRMDYVRWFNYRNQLRMGQVLETPTPLGFFLCEYPFLLDAKAKTTILQTDAVIHMQLAMDEVNQRTLMSIFSPIELPNPFLVLVVSRANLVQETLTQLTSFCRDDLRKPLKVVFTGEDAVDGGGVRKEFFMLLMKDLTDPKYGMFREYEETKRIWFNSQTFENEKMFYLIGLLCGLAIYNGNIVDLPFPLALYRKLLNDLVGVDDLEDLSPSLHRSLKYLLSYTSEDFADVFQQYFEISVETFGQVKTFELRQNGSKIQVTLENKEEYVAEYVDFLLNRSVEKQYRAFHNGFRTILSEHVLELFHAQELMAMVVGNENYDWTELESNAVYRDDYSVDHPTIKMLWEVFHELSYEKKKKFLLFLTGFDRIPVFGMKSLKVTIQPTGGGEDFLPVAHTCFNLLDLPRYTSKERLKEKLLMAIEHTQGFGLA
ncbi:putative E3 ubiquitin-protein ligase herc3 [Chamberlinius hualienensis]